MYSWVSPLLKGQGLGQRQESLGPFLEFCLWYVFLPGTGKKGIFCLAEPVFLPKSRLERYEIFLPPELNEVGEEGVTGW